KPIIQDPDSAHKISQSNNFCPRAFSETHGHSRATYTNTTKKEKWLKKERFGFFVLAALFSVFIPAQTAHAGLFSFFEKVFSNMNTVVKEQGLNSQNVGLLQAALNFDPNPSKGGGDITIVADSALLPDSGPLGTIADVEDAPQNGQISLYVVREGDSLSQIAKMFKVSVNTIIWANDIKRGNIIQPGQTLIILPVSGVQYTIARGDTLSSVAKKYKGSVEEIMQYNGIADSSAVSVGDTIIIPGGDVGLPIQSTQVTQTRVRGAGGPEYAGYYLRPVLGAVRSQGLHGYNGIDLAAPHGREVMASASGNVIIARDSGWNGGYGKYIVVSHTNGTQTLYAHLNGTIVHQGAVVVQGQVIGYVGSTGLSTGAHLHFEVRGAKNPF
ncbi:MAG: peptidoglycan DD-metalloendopeptidase family protein, partial [Parcubacteria group bacterium]|nr:peptidoglycan DD-metalloendopeptidase family protein [Parcubacteria group bacterium]